MSEKPKIFDDFQTIECEDCERYWINQCDGVKKGSKMPCNSFLATRSIKIPQEIEALKSAIKGLKTTVLILSVSVLLIAISNLLRWF